MLVLGIYFFYQIYNIILHVNGLKKIFLNFQIAPILVSLISKNNNFQSGMQFNF
jgi:hypothetical protein